MMTIIESIDRCLKTFDMILMLMDGDGGTENLIEDFCCSVAMKTTSKKVLILSTSGCLHPNDTDHYEYWKLTDEEQKRIQELYMMYDFSDHFHMISNDSKYGGLFNYVNAGIMTREEVFQALLN